MKPKGRKVCTYDGCTNLNHSQGLCSGHARQRDRGAELRPLRQPRETPTEGYSWCSRCSQYRAEEDFGYDPQRKALKRYCRPCASKQQKLYTSTHQYEVNLRVRLKKRGLTREQYDQMLAESGGRCAICERERPLDVDHCHAAGHVRGLLCGPCNRGIGFLDDDVSILRAAITYLERA